jgi:hypothetical protein
VRIEFIEVDNGSIIVRRVLRKGRGSAKIYKRFIEYKGYRVKA